MKSIEGGLYEVACSVALSWGIAFCLHQELNDYGGDGHRSIHTVACSDVAVTKSSAKGASSGRARAQLHQASRYERTR
jgi:hypothetical protein